MNSKNLFLECLDAVSNVKCPFFCVSAVDAVAAQIRQFKTFQSGVDVVTSQMMMQCVKIFCF